MNILIAEKMAAAGIDLLKSQPGWNVIVSSPKEYSQHLATAEALAVRSAVQVTREVLEKAPQLRVIGRAGVGVDNIDLDAATAAGVLVMNTPGGNAISVAEHTLALMLAMARHIPEANSTTLAGKWEKKSLLGNELRGKTLGIVGLGSIGREVVKRAQAFEMRIVAHDPYVTPEIARDAGVELLDLAAVFAQADYLSLHVSLTAETHHLLDRAAFEQMKTGVRIVNCARGELIDDQALAEALAGKRVAGAALDVFTTEPLPPGSALLQAPNLIATPHIAGSTEEAQEIVGVRIAQQMLEYLKNGVAINAVNMPPLTPEKYRILGPYIEVARRLGMFAARVARGNPKAVRLTYLGPFPENDTHLIRNSAVAGVLERSAARANAVNAMPIAKQRGWSVGERYEARSGHTDSIRLELETETGTTLVEGAVVLGRPRLIQVDGIYCEAPLAGHLVYMRNEDVPGVIGHVGTVLGRNGVNIANFSLGRGDEPPPAGRPSEAVAVVSTDSVVSDAVLDQLREHPAVKVARFVELDGRAQSVISA